MIGNELQPVKLYGSGSSYFTGKMEMYFRANGKMVYWIRKEKPGLANWRGRILGTMRVRAQNFDGDGWRA